MGNLRDKSIHELRVIAQAFGVSDIFEKEAKQLSQEIQIKQQQLTPPKAKPPERNPYDARLMDASPKEMAEPDTIVELLAPHIQRGLRLTLEEDAWFMSFGHRTDTGTMRMPLVHVLRCAERLMS